MSDYSAVAPPQQNFNDSTAFAAAVQRAKQIAAKIKPAGGPGERPKRPLEDGLEPDAKKIAGQGLGQGPPGVPGRGLQPPGMGGLNMSGGPPPMGGGPQINEDIKVPDKMVGLIIGRGGEQITRLQAEAGCKIQMAPDAAGSQERICSLSGTREAISRAKELILNIVHQRGRTEGLDGLNLGPGLGQGMNNGGLGAGGGGGGSGGGGGGGGGGLGSGGGLGGPGGGRNFVEIMVPGPKVGLIIGKGGETIKQLQERSGAKMVVIQDGPNQEQEKPLRISGDPQKVEYAKQLVYDLIAEKEMQAFNRGGPGGGGRRNDQQFGNEFGGNGGGGGNDVEVLVPRAAVGVVIGKGGDMIKKIQAETGARVQFQQARDEGPGERRCYLAGKPQNVEQARQRIEELIDSVHRRDSDGNGGGGPGGPRGPRPGGGGRDRFDNRGNRNGEGGFGGGWNERQQSGHEVSFTVPANKCGVIIGRGGETIKQINQQSGAHCELDRRNVQNQQNGAEKVFVIRGEIDQIETAKRIISEKVQLPLSFVSSGGPGQGMVPQGGGGGYGGAPSWGGGGGGMSGYGPAAAAAAVVAAQWGAQGGSGAGGGDTSQGGPGGVGPPGPGGAGPGGAAGGGQPDYSLQWAEYYRSLGMHREADVIEQQAKSKNAAAAVAPAPNAVVGGGNVPGAAPNAANGAQTDYSAQWAEYYRSIGKTKEAEAIEAQMKAKTQTGGAPMGAMGVAGAPAAAGNYQQQYGGYQAPGGYYGSGQGQAAQGQYGFPGYGYGGGAPGAQESN